MGFTFKAIINRDNRKNKTGIFTIYIRVTLDREIRYLNTSERIEEKYWRGDPEQHIKTTHPFAFQLNSLINKKLEHIRKYYYRQKLYDNPITLDGIAEHFSRKSDTNLFNEFVAEYMKNVKGKAPNTIKKYDTFVKYLNEFNPKISFGHLNESLFQAFATFLQNKGMMGVTVIKYFDPFKVITKQAVKDGFLEKDPFLYARIDVKATRGKRVHLEIEEVSKLKNCKIPVDRPDLVQTKTHWLFCFYAGFYYSDLLNLRWDNIKQTEFGLCVVGDRYKNEEAFVMPIHKFPAALDIIESQRGKDKELVFPGAISEQKFNAKLKDLAELAGIEKRLMNKTARHSAIQFWEAQGLPTQHTGKMVGHTKESTTKQYYDLSLRDINKRVQSFDFSTIDI